MLKEEEQQRTAAAISNNRKCRYCLNCLFCATAPFEKCCDCMKYCAWRCGDKILEKIIGCGACACIIILTILCIVLAGMASPQQALAASLRSPTGFIYDSAVESLKHTSVGSMIFVNLTQT